MRGAVAVRIKALQSMTLFVLDPSKLPGAPETFPKGWGMADWDCPDGVDVLEALRGAAIHG